MKHFITVIFGILSLCFLLILTKIAFLIFTDNIGYLAVFVGVLMPTIIAVLITSASYSAVKVDAQSCNKGN